MSFPLGTGTPVLSCFLGMRWPLFISSAGIFHLCPLSVTALISSFCPDPGAARSPSSVMRVPVLQGMRLPCKSVCKIHHLRSPCVFKGLYSLRGPVHRVAEWVGWRPLATVS